MIKQRIKQSLLLVFLVSFVACQNATDPSLDTTKSLAEKIVTTQVIEIQYRDTIKVPGKLAYENEYNMSFKTGGIIDQIMVHEGQIVKAGTMLAKLKKDEIDAKMIQAQTMKEKAQRDYYRAESLYADSVVTLEQLQNAKTQLQNAEADLQAVKFNQTHSTIEAPVSGVIQKIIMEENEIVGAGNPVIVFGAINEGMVLIAGMSDVNVVNLTLGDDAVISFDAWPDQKFKGQIKEIAGMANPVSGTYEIKIEIEDPFNKLKSGFIGSAQLISSQQEKCIKIPVEALLQGHKNIGMVYKVDQNKVIKQNVTIRAMKGDYLILSNGLAEQDHVVIEGLQYLSGNIIEL